MVTSNASNVTEVGYAAVEPRVPSGYKLTEVGVIPEDWETRTIADVSRNILDYRGRTPRKLGMDWGGGDIPALSARNVKMGYIDFEEECNWGSEALYKRWMTNGDAAKDDIVITMEAPLGNIAQIPDARKYILSQRTVLLQLNPDQSDSQFLFQVMRSERFQSVLSENATGSTAKGIQRRKFEKLRVVRPSLPEQRAIAAALRDADALIGALEKLITKKRDLKLAAMHELLTGEKRLPGFEKVPGYKQTEVGVIPEDWEPTALAQVCAFITKGSTPTTYGFKWEQSGVLFLRSECVSERGLDLGQSMFVSPSAHAALRRSEVEDGDILVTITGNVGRVVLLRGVGKANLNQHIAKVRVTNPKAHAEYVFHFLSQPASRSRFTSITTGQAYPQISLKQVREAIIPFPPTKAEQEGIATALSDMDAEIAALEAKLAKAQQIKQGMMQELLTGRIRLV